MFWPITPHAMGADWRRPELPSGRGDERRTYRRAVFPFNLMFLPEIYDLEHQIGGAAIRDVEDLTGLLGRKIVICYDDRGLRKLELRVRKPDAFIDALRRLQSLV